MGDTMKRYDLNIIIHWYIAVMGSLDLSSGRMSKNLDILFPAHAVQYNLENSAANSKFLSFFSFLMKLEVFLLLKYSVDPGILKDKTYKKFIQIIMDCWKLKSFPNRIRVPISSFGIKRRRLLWVRKCLEWSSVWLLIMQSKQRNNPDKTILRFDF